MLAEGGWIIFQGCLQLCCSQGSSCTSRSPHTLCHVLGSSATSSGLCVTPHPCGVSASLPAPQTPHPLFPVPISGANPTPDTLGGAGDDNNDSDQIGEGWVKEQLIDNWLT